MNMQDDLTTMFCSENIKIDWFIGKVIEKIEGKVQDEEIFFYVNDGNAIYKVKMYHSQNCCESVYLEDIVGEMHDILNQDINTAGEKHSVIGSSTQYTFYELGTPKDSIIFRWCGESQNYSTEVELEIVDIKYE